MWHTQAMHLPEMYTKNGRIIWMLKKSEYVWETTRATIYYSNGMNSNGQFKYTLFTIKYGIPIFPRTVIIYVIYMCVCNFLDCVLHIFSVSRYKYICIDWLYVCELLNLYQRTRDFIHACIIEEKMCTLLAHIFSIGSSVQIRIMSETILNKSWRFFSVHNFSLKYDQGNGQIYVLLQFLLLLNSIVFLFENAHEMNWGS